jgi:hypothetical protein
MTLPLVGPLLDNKKFLFLYSILINDWTCSRPEYRWNIARWMLINTQSINHVRDFLIKRLLVKSVRGPRFYCQWSKGYVYLEE